MAKEKIPEGQIKYCGGCGKEIHKEATKCPSCGYEVKGVTSTSKVMAIIGLIVNLFIWPGLGTLIGGNTGTGVIQMVLALISIPLIFILIGIPLLIGVWIWALVSSIQQINKSE